MRARLTWILMAGVVVVSCAIAFRVYTWTMYSEFKFESSELG